VSTHLDLDGLADLLAGEGADDDVRHVSGCARCSAALADVEQAQAPVRRELAALPEPAVPADLAARLDAALLRAQQDELDAPARTAAVALTPATAAGPTTVVPRSARATPRSSRATPRGRGLLAVAAGAAAVLVLGGAAVLAQRATGPDAADSATAGAAADQGAPSLVNPRPVTRSSGTDYASADVVRAAVPDLLAAAAPEAQTAASPDPLARLREPGALADCLSGLADPATDGVPLALDYARWAGAPALLVVLPAGAPGRVDVFVVGEGCRAGDEQTRLYTQVPRPS
jgi:hypothetical protein